MLIRIVVLLALVFGIGGCGGGGGASGTAGTATLQSLAVSPATLTVGTGAIQGYTVTGTYSDATTQDLTASASWTSSATGVATVVSTTGVATSVAAGSATITASVSGKTANAALTVTATATKKLSNTVTNPITVTPAYVNITPGTTKQLTATGTYSDNSTADISSSVTWTSSDKTVATVNNSGLVTAGGATGSVLITASKGAAKSVSRVRIMTTTPSSLTVSPQFVQTGHSWDPATWASATIGIYGQSSYPASWALPSCTPANAAYVDADGWIYANLAGTCQLTASVSTNSGTITSPATTLTIADPTISSITVTPATTTVANGGTLQFNAMATYSDGTTKDLTNMVQWSSSNTAAITIANGGLATGQGPGTATITAQMLIFGGGGGTGSTTLTVPASAPVQGAATIAGSAAVYDNTISISSLTPSWQTTTFAVNAFHSNSIAVGCNWMLMYDPIAVMQIQHLNCAQSLVKFNLASIPAGKTVVNAVLKLQTSIYGVGYVPRQWYVHAMAGFWNPASVTWDNAPGQYYVASHSVQNPPSPTNMTFNIDVTNTVRNWHSGAWQNNGFGFGITDYLFPYQISLDAFEFYSSEDPGGRGPQLVVTYQ